MATRSTRSTPPAAGKAADPGARVLRRFRLVFNAVKSHFRAVENKAGVSGAQLWALHVVREQPGIGVGGLARAMDIHQSTASNLLKTLTERKLIVASREGADRRSVSLRVLPAGQDVLRVAPGPFAGVLPDALAGLDEATLARLEEDLAVLIKVLAPDESVGKQLPLAQL
jgi:DNA-binding MarR family transcriptional regulator